MNPLYTQTIRLFDRKTCWVYQTLEFASDSSNWVITPSTNHLGPTNLPPNQKAKTKHSFFILKQTLLKNELISSSLKMLQQNCIAYQYFPTCTDFNCRYQYISLLATACNWLLKHALEFEPFEWLEAVPGTKWSNCGWVLGL